jgi:hypothetical protein
VQARKTVTVPFGTLPRTPTQSRKRQLALHIPRVFLPSMITAANTHLLKGSRPWL